MFLKFCHRAAKCKITCNSKYCELIIEPNFALNKKKLQNKISTFNYKISTKTNNCKFMLHEAFSLFFLYFFYKSFQWLIFHIFYFFTLAHLRVIYSFPHWILGHSYTCKLKNRIVYFILMFTKYRTIRLNQSSDGSTVDYFVWTGNTLSLAWL